MVQETTQYCVMTYMGKESKKDIQIDRYIDR